MWLVAFTLLVVGIFFGFFLAAILGSRRSSELYLQAEWWRVRYEQVQRPQSPRASIHARWN